MAVSGFRPVLGALALSTAGFTLAGDNAGFCSAILRKTAGSQPARLESLTYILPGQTPELGEANHQPPMVVNLLMQLRASCDQNNIYLRTGQASQAQIMAQLRQTLARSDRAVRAQAGAIERSVRNSLFQENEFRQALAQLEREVKKNEDRPERAAMPVRGGRGTVKPEPLAVGRIAERVPLSTGRYLRAPLGRDGQPGIPFPGWPAAQPKARQGKAGNSNVPGRHIATKIEGRRHSKASGASEWKTEAQDEAGQDVILSGALIFPERVEPVWGTASELPVHRAAPPRKAGRITERADNGIHPAYQPSAAAGEQEPGGLPLSGIHVAGGVGAALPGIVREVRQFPPDGIRAWTDAEKISNDGGGRKVPALSPPYLAGAGVQANTFRMLYDGTFPIRLPLTAGAIAPPVSFVWRSGMDRTCLTERNFNRRTVAVRRFAFGGAADHASAPLTSAAAHPRRIVFRLRTDDIRALTVRHADGDSAAARESGGTRPAPFFRVAGKHLSVLSLQRIFGMGTAWLRGAAGPAQRILERQTAASAASITPFPSGGRMLQTLDWLLPVLPTDSISTRPYVNGFSPDLRAAAQTIDRNRQETVFSERSGLSQQPAMGRKDPWLTAPGAFLIKRHKEVHFPPEIHFPPRPGTRSGVGGDTILRWINMAQAVAGSVPAEQGNLPSNNHIFGFAAQLSPPYGRNVRFDSAAVPAKLFHVWDKRVDLGSDLRQESGRNLPIGLRFASVPGEYGSQTRPYQRLTADAAAVAERNPAGSPVSARPNSRLFFSSVGNHFGEINFQRTLGMETVGFREVAGPVQKILKRLAEAFAANMTPVPIGNKALQSLNWLLPVQLAGSISSASYTNRSSLNSRATGQTIYQNEYGQEAAFSGHNRPNQWSAERRMSPWLATPGTFPVERDRTIYFPPEFRFLPRTGARSGAGEETILRWLSMAQTVAGAVPAEQGSLPLKNRVSGFAARLSPLYRKNFHFDGTAAVPGRNPAVDPVSARFAPRFLHRTLARAGEGSSLPQNGAARRALRQTGEKVLRTPEINAPFRAEKAPSGAQGVLFAGGETVLRAHNAFFRAKKAPSGAQGVSFAGGETVLRVQNAFFRAETGAIRMGNHPLRLGVRTPQTGNGRFPAGTKGLPVDTSLTKADRNTASGLPGLAHFASPLEPLEGTLSDVISSGRKGNAARGGGPAMIFRMPAPAAGKAPSPQEQEGEAVLAAQTVGSDQVRAMNRAFSYSAPAATVRAEPASGTQLEQPVTATGQLNYNRLTEELLVRIERRLRAERRKFGL